MIEIVEAHTDELIVKAQELFREYAGSLDFDLSFQDFNAELENLSGQYSPPTGDLFLAVSGTQIAGCAGLRYFAEGICEMKRLYVRPTHRGNNAGRELAESVIRAGKRFGYERMRIDTLPSMETANRLYESLGFVEIEPYRYNPVAGARYLELDLTQW
ncbi:MAG TPA: GNAT family N-acetyltransferase [Syntrophales bacterium]|nr:GNAT family N-acetyltransferase [Syntrophales bacterium]HPQ43948.1 GNAT family N-acetyltransferase [Syntrophales bacterium]